MNIIGNDRHYLLAMASVVLLILVLFLHMLTNQSLQYITVSVLMPQCRVKQKFIGLVLLQGHNNSVSAGNV